MQSERIRVLCVDDNPLVAEGVRIKTSMDNSFEWAGHLPCADGLVAHIMEVRTKNQQPHVVLLDLDMPGKDALEALAELAALAPEVRVIILSGYAREDFLDRAVEAGAWGYVSKNDGPDEILHAARRVINGQFAFGTSVLGQCGAG